MLQNSYVFLAVNGPFMTRCQKEKEHFHQPNLWLDSPTSGASFNLNRRVYILCGPDF